MPLRPLFRRGRYARSSRHEWRPRTPPLTPLSGQDRPPIPSPELAKDPSDPMARLLASSPPRLNLGRISDGRLRTDKANRVCRGDEATRSPTPSQTAERAVVRLPASKGIACDAAPALGEGREPTGDAVSVVETAASGVRLHVAEEVEVSVARRVRASPIESAVQAGVDAKGRGDSAAGLGAGAAETARSVRRRSCTAASTLEPRKLSSAPPESPSTSASTRMPLAPR